MKINFAGAALPKSGVLVVLADEGGKLFPQGTLAGAQPEGGPASQFLRR